VRRAHAASRALALGALFALPAAAQPTPPPEAEPTTAESAAAPPGDLQSPEQRSTRNSAYTTPQGTLAFDLGALGITGGEAYSIFGVAYGLGAGVEIEANLAHMSVGLLNLSAAWHFIDTRYFDLGLRVGVWYGHGAWFWIGTDAVRAVVSNLDVVSLPLLLTASAPLTRWLQLDLGVQYTYADIFGVTTDESSIFEDVEIGVRQLFFRPGARLFVTDSTALELFVKLPAFTDVPTDGGGKTLPFSRTWMLEGGLRSRLADGLFGTLRLHYGDTPGVVYGSVLYPSFDIELHL
jgi:hypothetical protein